jgi:hypothetical protein
MNNITCSCGGGPGAHHPISENGCLRYVVTDPKEIPTNRRISKDPRYNSSKTPVYVWDVGGITITEYTLIYQRMYAQKEDGTWTRPKSKDSTNSLEGDW